MERFEILGRGSTRPFFDLMLNESVEGETALEAVEGMVESANATPREMMKHLVDRQEPYMLVAARNLETGVLALVHVHPTPEGFMVHYDALVEQPDNDPLHFNELSMN